VGIISKNGSEKRGTREIRGGKGALRRDGKPDSAVGDLWVVPVR